MMKPFFEEPKLCVEQFSVADQLLLSSISLNADELQPYSIPVITAR